MNLAQKLIEVRKIVPYLKKDTQSHQYTYVSGSTVLGVLKEKMDELGLLLIPELNDITEEKIVKADGKIDFKVYGKLIYKWLDAESGESLDVCFYMTGMQADSSKAFGSALTYSERYFLLKFFNIATDKDDPDFYEKKIDKLTGDVNELYSNIKVAMEHLRSKGISQEEINKVSKTHLGTENYLEISNIKVLEKFIVSLRQLYSQPRINKAEAYDLLETKKFGSKQEKEIMKEAIDKTESEHDLKILLGTLNSRADKKQPELSEPKEPEQVVDETEKVPEKSEIDDNIAQLQEKVKTQVKFLADKGIDDFNVMARRNNSIKEHLKVDKIELCTEATLLTSYSDTLKAKFETWKEGQK